MLVWLALAALGMVIIATTARERARYQAPRRVAPAPVSELTAPDGDGGAAGGAAYAVVGTAEAGPNGPARAPLSGNDCVWYRIVVASYGRLALGRLWHGRWVTGRTNPPVLTVTDGTGSVLVAPDAGFVPPWQPSFSRVERSAWAGAQPRGSLAGRVQRLSGHRGSLALQPDTPYEFVEWTLTAGERVYVFGRADQSAGRTVLRVPRRGPYLVAKGGERTVRPPMGRQIAVGYGCGFAMAVTGLGVAIVGLLLGVPLAGP